ncbi:MAG: polyprenyl synthetase family protein [Acidimicrobiia bacterium]
MNLDTLGLAPLTDDMSRVELELATTVRNSDAFLSDVAAHLLSAGGKRLRPALTLASYYAACGDERASDAAVTGAAAVELVHLGSLYHDDVIDEAATRRGVPSVNARWNNITAILSGDYLLAQASGLAASLGADVAALLAATIAELCRGEVLELQHLFDAERTVASYLSAIDGKTAALFATSCRIGGMVSGVSEPTLHALDTFGRNLGMCFQIIDDVLDLTADDAALGKPAGNDIAEGVYTLPVLYAIEANPTVRDLLGGPVTESARNEARQRTLDADGVGRALTVAREHAGAASAALNAAPGLDQRVVHRLSQLVDGLLERSS